MTTVATVTGSVSWFRLVASKTVITTFSLESQLRTASRRLKNSHTAERILKSFLDAIVMGKAFDWSHCLYKQGSVVFLTLPPGEL